MLARPVAPPLALRVAAHSRVNTITKLLVIFLRHFYTCVGIGQNPGPRQNNTTRR
ncbi:uncharacterized protein BCN122_II0838 [Burkholderia cenocepacia]|nr:uncharacterized protein BCN122_II0838 [Burkholderia cenocepacia]